MLSVRYEAQRQEKSLSRPGVTSRIVRGRRLVPADVFAGLLEHSMFRYEPLRGAVMLNFTDCTKASLDGSSGGTTRRVFRSLVEEHRATMSSSIFGWG